MTDPPQGSQPWQATPPAASPPTWGTPPSATPSWPGPSVPRRAYDSAPTSSPPDPALPSQQPARAAEPFDATHSADATASPEVRQWSSPYGPAQGQRDVPPWAEAPPYGASPTAPYGPSQPSGYAPPPFPYASGAPSYSASQGRPYGAAQSPLAHQGRVDHPTDPHGGESPYGPGTPPQGYAPQGYPPQGYPPPSYPPQGYSPQGYSPQGYPPSYAPQGYAAQGYSAQGYPPGAPPWASTTQWAPPSSYPAGVPQPYGPYGPDHLQGPRHRKTHRGRTLLVLLAIAALVAAALPIISTIATSGYANSSYVPPPPDSNPPALPRIANGTSAHDTVTSNALYGQSVPNPTKCTVTTIDLAAASESELQSHMSDVVACLMRVWDLPVTKAGYSLPRPPVVVYSAAMNTACGKLATLNAAYCGSDQKIYYATDLPQAIPSQLRSSRFIVEVIVAHEFGHAVQARTGILTAAHGLADAASTEAESHEWSRRTELQADCFAGLFIRSVSKSTGITQQDLDNIASLMIAFGDDSLSKTTGVDGGHGLGTTRKYWMQLGLASTSTSVCDTFTVASDEVR